MSAYHVAIRPQAQRVADRLWRTSPNPPAIQRSVDQLIAKLSRNPETIGVELELGRLVAYEHPLAAVYRIDADRKTVYVLELWHIDEAENN